MIKQEFFHGRKAYGIRRIKKKLTEQNIVVSRRRIGRLMKISDLKCTTIKRKYKVTTNFNHNRPIVPNLLARRFIVDKVNRYWVSDITYIPTKEGWLYLAVVIDLYSRQVVGWSMDRYMQAELVNNALLMALWKRKPNKGLIYHSDRGSQYAADSHKRIIKDHNIIQSMSASGNCWDNAVAESFFHTFKTELIYQYKFNTREEAKQTIFEY